MKKYLVTGSTGFIGSRLLGLLKTKECEVRLLAKSEVKNYETVVCNLGQDRIPKRALETIDTVFHLAGLAHDVQGPRKVEELYRKINVQATVELARLAVKNGVKQFVFISSVKAGGLPLFSQYASEELGGESDSIYGKTKQEAELQLLKIGNESGMHVSIIRPSLVYGPNVKGNLQLMLSGVKQGWFPPLPETNNKRSMIHVDDLVRAIFLIAKDERANGEIFIATDSTAHSSRDIYNAMCNVIGKSTPKWSVPQILFDIVSLLSPNIKYKINKLLGDEFYSSVKLEELGFKAQKTLRHMNETDF
jgi:UDP-glucose 4-epimerase